jgi:hypothetical protein
MVLAIGMPNTVAWGNWVWLKVVTTNRVSCDPSLFAKPGTALAS